MENGHLVKMMLKEDLNSESRLVSKNRLSWVLISFWAIILGLLYYLLPLIFDFTAVLIAFAILTLIYTTVCELATKAFESYLAKSVFVYPLGSIVAFAINHFSPKYSYVPADPLQYFFMLYIILLVICTLASYSGNILARLVSGYEALSTQPIAKSFSLKGKKEATHTLLESFLKSLNIQPTIVIRGTQKCFKFGSGSNQHFLFLNPADDDSTEVNLLTLRWRKDTILDPDRKDLDMFLTYLECFLNKKRDGEELDEWTSNFKPKFEKQMTQRVWGNYTSPLKVTEKLALRGVITQRFMNFIKSHKAAILTFVGGVLAVVIGQLIISYFFPLIGI